MIPGRLGIASRGHQLGHGRARAIVAGAQCFSDGEQAGVAERLDLPDVGPSQQVEGELAAAEFGGQLGRAEHQIGVPGLVGDQRGGPIQRRDRHRHRAPPRGPAGQRLQFRGNAIIRAQHRRSQMPDPPVVPVPDDLRQRPVNALPVTHWQGLVDSRAGQRMTEHHPVAVEPVGDPSAESIAEVKNPSGMGDPIGRSTLRVMDRSAQSCGRRDGAPGDEPGTCGAAEFLGDRRREAEGGRRGDVDDQQHGPRDGLVVRGPGFDDRVEGQMQRGRALGGPDRPDRGT
jgi:hypothetical protein